MNSAFRAKWEYSSSALSDLSPVRKLSNVNDALVVAFLKYFGSDWFVRLSRIGPGLRPLSLRANISETVLVLLINEQGEKEKGRDEREFSWFCFFWKLGCHGTERRRAWRAEAEWSGSPSGCRFAAGLAA